MWIVLVVGTVFVLAGLAAYTGRWRSFTANYVISPDVNFGLLWLGLAGWCAALFLLIGALALPLGLLAFGCFAVSLLSLLRLPASLTPGWFREWKARGMDRNDFAPAPPSRRLFGRRGG